jgi:four helix bundle protein
VAGYCELITIKRRGVMFEFDFERLKVYQFAISFFRKVIKETKILSRDLQFSLGDQFRRAALSICNNIAEGSGKESKKEKIYYFCTSMHSARECIPMITILFEEKVIDSNIYMGLRSDCRQITSMLNGLIKSLG